MAAFKLIGSGHRVLGRTWFAPALSRASCVDATGSDLCPIVVGKRFRYRSALKLATSRDTHGHPVRLLGP